MNDNETVDDVLADMLLPRFDAITAMRANNYDEIKSLVANYRDRIEAAYKREITILIDALAEVVASIEVRFPAIEYALDRKPYLDAKKILEQYKEEAALDTTSSQTTQED